MTSEQMYIQQNVEQALAALEENLKTADGKRMLEEDMISKNLPVSCEFFCMAATAATAAAAAAAVLPCSSTFLLAACSSRLAIAHTHTH